MGTRKENHWNLYDVREEDDAEVQVHYSPLRKVFRVSACLENDILEAEFDATGDPLLGMNEADEKQANSLATKLIEKLEMGAD